jgi:DNA-directed RNA polymerase subunit alpha
MRKLLKTSLEDLDLSVRAYNCLKAAKINSLSELVKYDTHELLKFRNFGKKSLVEIEELLQEKGLSFGMDLSKFKLEEEN